MTGLSLSLSRFPETSAKTDRSTCWDASEATPRWLANLKVIFSKSLGKKSGLPTVGQLACVGPRSSRLLPLPLSFSPFPHLCFFTNFDFSTWAFIGRPAGSSETGPPLTGSFTVIRERDSSGQIGRRKLYYSFHGLFTYVNLNSPTEFELRSGPVSFFLLPTVVISRLIEKKKRKKSRRNNVGEHTPVFAFRTNIYLARETFSIMLNARLIEIHQLA